MIHMPRYIILTAGLLSTSCMAQSVYNVPPDEFPSQSELDANPGSIINIAFLNQGFNNPRPIADLNGAVIDIQGDWIPTINGFDYSNGTFVVNGRIGNSTGSALIFRNCDIIIEEGGLIDFDTQLRQSSLVRFMGGTFFEDFLAADSRLEMYSGRFSPDGDSGFGSNSTFEIFDGLFGGGQLSGGDTASGIIHEGTIALSLIRGFDTISIHGGLWPVDGVRIDIGTLEIDGTCLAIDGIRIESTVGQPISLSGSQLPEEISVVLPNQKRFRAEIQNTAGTVIFIPIGKPCLADYDCNANLDFFDISVFIDAFMNHDVIADLTGEGEFDFFDVSMFLNAFNTGCL